MGLASALSTALTGMGASQSTIDVVGNNLANSSTTGFKASTAVFATQFSQTLSLGSGPQGTSGGTNPQQIGLGTETAEIAPNFSQGTIQVSSNPSDLAIQGQGFFIVQGNNGGTLYTRDGQFGTNSQNELVTPTGDKLLGFGVDNSFNVKTTTLTPLTIPLGTTTVAQATKNVFFQGTLPPSGNLANQAEIIQSGILGDSRYSSPAAGSAASVAVAPILGSAAGAPSGAGPLIPGSSYQYKVAFTDASGNESDSATFTATIPGSTVGNSAMSITNLPTDSSGKYVGRRIYRTQDLATAGANPTFFLDKDLSADNTTTSYSDSTSDATLATQAQQNTSTLSGNYSYYVTYIKPGVPESHPSPLIGPQNVTGDRIVLSGIPAPTGQYAGGQARIYRNVSTNPSVFFRVAEVNSGASFVDHISDATISDTSLPGYQAIDFSGPKVTPNTPLIDVQTFDGVNYTSPFQAGTLAFSGQKGGRTLTTKDLTITSTTTIQNLVDFVSQATGIQPASADPAHPVPGDITGAAQGGSVLANGRLQFISNNGVDNAVDIPLSSFVLTAGGANSNPNMSFTASQKAKGTTVASDFISYDSLGIPVNVRVTADLEAQNSTSTTYRWFADSSDNQPINGVGTAVGTGLITFDGNGNVVSVSNSTVTIQRSQTPSGSLQFNLDFGQLSGLSTATATLTTSRQDGSGAGSLSSFIINADGKINGVFTNGVTRTLGQIQLARFTNPEGLVAQGSNAYAAGVNSGLPIQGNPGGQGIGSIVGGALEQSNTDVGTNLIKLILASTQYQGNTRVVSTVNTLFNDLLTLGR